MTQVAPTTSHQLASVEPLQSIPTYRPIPAVGWSYLWQQTATSLPLMAGDVAAVLFSSAVTYGLVGGILGWSLWFSVAFLAVASLLGMRLMGLYPAIGVHPAFEMRQMLTLIVVVSLCLLFASFEQEFVQHRSWWAVATLGIVWSMAGPTGRSITRSIFQRFDWWTQPVLIVGNNEQFQKARAEFAQNRSHGLRPVGYFCDTRKQWFGAPIEESQLLGDSQEAVEYARRHRIYWAVILEVSPADENGDSPDLAGIPHRLYKRDSSDAIPSIWDELFYLNRTSYIHQTDKLLLPHNLWLKRAMDLSVASILVVVTAPLVLLLAAIVKLTSRGPVFYRSERVGAHGRCFAMTKFRTMRQDSQAYLEQYLEVHPERRTEWEKEQKLKDDPRVTWVGRFLRRTSLDELPQIYDVFRGKMSLVGPRPMLLNEPALYGDRFQAFCRMLPGITGLWQVSGRNRISHDQRTELVSYYVQNWSPWLDVYLLAKTFKVVISGDGAY